jgi:hypothetical protein
VIAGGEGGWSGRHPGRDSRSCGHPANPECAMFNYETESSKASTRRMKFFWILAAAAFAVGSLLAMAMG